MHRRKQKDRQLKYMRGLVIVHGLSERTLFEVIKQNLKLPIKVYSEKKGGKAIQINTLENLFANLVFKSKENFCQGYPACVDDNTGEIVEDFKIYIIMDTDDCISKEQKKSFKNGLMFRKHRWIHKYVVLIYNDSKLEDTLAAAGISIKKNKDYSDFLGLHLQEPNPKKLQELSEKFKKNPNTNMERLLDDCIELYKRN